MGDTAGRNDMPQAPERLPSPEDEAYPIRILPDGTWTYHGSPIGRPKLVRLFASVLRRDAAGDHWLITPAERGRIVVDDAPFVAVAMTTEGEGRDRRLVFRTNIDEEAEAGPARPILVRGDPGTDEPRPYVVVRPGADGAPGIEARIARPVFYDLVDLAEPDPADPGRLGVWAGGAFFPLGRAEAA